MWWKHRRKPTNSKWRNIDDLTEFLSQLPAVRVGANGYTEADRAADFRAVFSTEQGSRVLSQIATLCDPAISLSDTDKLGRLAYKSGMRAVMQNIQRCFVVREETDRLIVEAEDGEG